MRTAISWLGLLGLVTLAPGCLDYGTRSDPCKDLGCALECASDQDCPVGSECLQTQDGCCSQCEPSPCLTNEDCPICHACDPDRGECLADPCAVECFEDGDCRAGRRCQTDALGCCGSCVIEVCASDADCAVCEACDPISGECLATPCGPECLYDSDCGFEERCVTDDLGCCYHCEPYDRCAGLDCVATCVMDEDCPRDSLCYVYEDGCCSMCVPADQEVLLTPTCVHAPWIVGAGGDFPLAVYGTPGCGWFDRVEVDADGFDIQVRIIGRTSADPDCPPLNVCEAQDWTYMGLIWLSAPNPGAYTITVSESQQLVVGASGGIVEDPACQDDCAWPLLEQTSWTMVHSTAQDLSAGCGLHKNDGRPVLFEGDCQSYAVLADPWPFPGEAFHCRDEWVTFGSGPPFQAEASVCNLGDPHNPPLMLGVGWVGEFGDQQAQAFLLEAQ